MYSQYLYLFISVKFFIPDTKDYFTYTTEICIMVGVNQAVPRETPGPSAGCWKTDEASVIWISTDINSTGEQLQVHCTVTTG